MKKAIALSAAAVTAISALTASALTIDGTIGAGEWGGAAIYTIGTQGSGASVGTAYLRADQSYVYAAFDITGWTAAMGANSQGNLLGLGVQKGNGSYPSGTWVEFQQSTDPQSWGGGAPTATMNGLASAYRENSAIIGALPMNLQAMDSFATGHRVWEVMLPLAFLGGLNVGGTIDIVGGINFGGLTHWYPAAFGATPYSSFNEGNYAHISVEAPLLVDGPRPVPDGGLTLALLGGALTGLVILHRKLSA